MSSKARTVISSKRSATTTPTVGPSKSSSSSTTKIDVSSKPCKLCAQDTVLAAPSVKRKGDPSYNATVSTSTPGTSDGRKIGENKLLSKTNKNTRYPTSCLMGRSLTLDFRLMEGLVSLVDRERIGLEQSIVMLALIRRGVVYVILYFNDGD